ncbi:hypothetical protein [Burkholderia sp. Ac-20353]|uniref:hypothetical protein n=1 Tax=Burkholderia sp. Ac-20353 TaxID=2703894 RepID=UPI00197B8465|nr:hypothetical protein [Burkholderia sp. Ac-20353]MBN3785555.1 hypothetical protein [Burkholderia sp. Ac-20353]
MLYADVFGIDPQDVMREICALEGISESRTKPGTPFKVGGSLEGLHHKHFTTSSISMVASNMLAVNGRRALRKLAEEKFADGFSAEAIASFLHAVAIESYERRVESSTLTGEWIVYAEHQERKYYLCLATHQGGNDEVLGYVRNVARLEFAFLQDQLPHLFDGA